MTLPDPFIPRFVSARDTSVGQLLIKAARVFHEAGMAEIQANGHPGLTAAHFQLAPHMDLAGSRITDVARKAGISKQAVGQLVDELQGLGYVTRVPDPTDARARLVVLTDQGRTAMFAGLAALARVEARVRHDLGDVGPFRSQLETVIRLLDRPS